MDAYGVAFSVLIGAMAVVFANVRAFQSDEVRRERYVRNGVLKSSDTPTADAPTAFIQREASRERQALIGSAILTLVGVVVLAVAGPPTMQAIAFVVMCSAFLGRSVVLAVLAAREALRLRSGGPRVSHGAVWGVGARLNRLPYLLATALQLIFLIFYVPASLALRPDVAGWVMALAVLSVVASVGGWVLAAWVARQPQAAADPVELAWSDAGRRRDLSAILVVGPVLAAGVLVSAFTYGGGGPTGTPVGYLPWLAFGYMVAAIALTIVAGIVQHRADARRKVAPC